MRMLRIVLPGLGISASAMVLLAGSGAAPALQRLPVTAYASQAGPGVPIASGHFYTLNIGSGAMADLGLPISNGASLAYDPPNTRVLGWGGIAQPNGPALGGLFDLTTIPGTLIGSAVSARF